MVEQADTHTGRQESHLNEWHITSFVKVICFAPWCSWLTSYYWRFRLNPALKLCKFLPFGQHVAETSLIQSNSCLCFLEGNLNVTLAWGTVIYYSNLPVMNSHLKTWHFYSILSMKCTTKILIKSYSLAYDLIRTTISCSGADKELRTQGRQLTLPSAYALLSFSFSLQSIIWIQ